MFCYRDMTFCIANCRTTCPIKLTPQVEEAAAKWWGSSDAPIALTDYSPSCKEFTPMTTYLCPNCRRTFQATNPRSCPHCVYTTPLSSTSDDSTDFIVLAAVAATCFDSPPNSCSSLYDSSSYDSSSSSSD